MNSSTPEPLPRLQRSRPAGVAAGAKLTRIDGPMEALALVADELARAEGHFAELLHSDVRHVPAVSHYLNEAGGKRLRPALTALAGRTLGVDRDLTRLMCVGELIHLGSLLHDDVVDDGLTRRGKVATHRVHGAPVTILTGDFCLARAVLLAAEEGGHRCVTELGRAVTEMAEGEVLQLARAHDLNTDVDGYYDVIDRKSAALISWCAAAPAWAIGDEAAAEALRRFGRGVGRAFQIADDVLDYNPKTGKTLGADLRERKVTLPLIYAMQATPSLRDALAEGDPADADIPALVRQVQDSGGLDAARADAHQFATDALSALDVLPEGIGRDALRVLGRYLVERTQ